jgi:hypothetical protein
MKIRIWNLVFVVLIISLFSTTSVSAVTIVIPSIERSVDLSDAIGVYRLEASQTTLNEGLDGRTTLMRSLKSNPPKALSSLQRISCLSQLKKQENGVEFKAGRILAFLRSDAGNGSTVFHCLSLDSLPTGGYSVPVTHQFKILKNERSLLKEVRARLKATTNRGVSFESNKRFDSGPVRIPYLVERKMDRNSQNVSIVLGVPKDLEVASKKAFFDF